MNFFLHFQAPSEKKLVVNQPDDSISFLQLFSKSDQGAAEVGFTLINSKLWEVVKTRDKCGNSR